MKHNRFTLLYSFQVYSRVIQLYRHIHTHTNMKVKSLSRVRLFATPWTVTYQAPLSMDFPGNSTGMDCHFLLQRIFPTQGSNPGLPHCRRPLYSLSHQYTAPVFCVSPSWIPSGYTVEGGWWLLLLCLLIWQATFFFHIAVFHRQSREF